MRMRKYFIALLAGVLLAACSGKAPEKGALILGKATGFTTQDTVVASLFKVSDGNGKSVARDTLQDGRFSFRLDSLDVESDHYTILFRRLKGGRMIPMTSASGPEIYLEPGALVRIKSEGRYYLNARIDSPVRDQKLRERFMRKVSREDLKTLRDIIADQQQFLDETEERNDWTREQVDSLRAVDKEYKDAAHAITNRILKQELELLQTEEIGAYALGELWTLAAHSSFNGIKEYREPILRAYERLSDEQKVTRRGMEILNFLNPVEKTKVGSPAPDDALVDPQGKTVRISDFRGKWVLLDFWGKNCKNCSRAIPELGAVSRDFRETLAVVSISVDRESVWKRASAEHGIFWNDWNDPKGTSGSIRSYGANGLPTFVLISPEGIIERILVGYQEGVLRSAAALSEQ